MATNESDQGKWNLSPEFNYTPEMTRSRIFVLIFFSKNLKVGYTKNEIVAGVEEVLREKAAHSEIKRITNPLLSSVTFKRMIDPLCQAGYIKKEGKTSITKYLVGNNALLEAYVTFEKTRKKISVEAKVRDVVRAVKYKEQEEEKDKKEVDSNGKEENSKKN